MGDLARSRVNRSVDEVDRLRGRVEEWHGRRSAADPNHQYESVLRVICEEVDASLARLRPEYAALESCARGEAYDACRRLDAILVFVWQLWDWYREKFDQRDTPISPLLLAADEVVHSCYCTAFPKRASRPAPEPLVFVEPTLAPDAQRWHVLPEGIDPPAEPTDASARILGEKISALPVPTIRFPMLALDEPWMLALLAHEVGHHVQQGVGGDVWTGFGTSLGACAAAQLDPSVAGRWHGWGREIFADVFGVLALGPWLTWAISELEWRADADMGSGSVAYPPPPLRWTLMLATLEAAGLAAQPASVADAVSATRSLPADVTLGMSAELTAAKAIAATLLDANKDPAVPSFLSLSGFSVDHHGPKGAVQTWANRLTGAGNPVKSANRSDARLCAAAAAKAWAELPPSASRCRREELAGRVLAQLSICHEPGTRAAGPEIKPPQRTLVDELLTLSAEDLGVAS